MNCAFCKLCVLGDSIVSTYIPKFKVKLVAFKLEMVAIWVIQSNLDFVIFEWLPVLGVHRSGCGNLQLTNIRIG
jgi:hypothetical protein